MNVRWRALAFLAVTLLVPATADARSSSASGRGTVVRQLEFANTKIALSFAPAEFQLSEAEIVDWVLRSARATATYFGRFPVGKVQVFIEPARGDEVAEGITYADPDAEIRIGLGRNTARATLKADTTMVHEMTHLGFPDVDDSHLWLHEGIATYVEVVASAQALEMSPAKAWARFTRILPRGMPEDGDKGLDNTQNEDRRYWGGALFCLMADIEIRRRTDNAMGLRDALRAILEAGGTLSNTWQAERALRIGDAAVGVPVLLELYATWRKNPVSPDLVSLWSELGIRRTDGGIRLIDTGALVDIRRAITDIPERPLLLAAPTLVRESMPGP